VGLTHPTTAQHHSLSPNATQTKKSL